MQKKDSLTYSEITTMAEQMKLVCAQINDLLLILQKEDFARIGENGDVWIGDAANMAHQAFDDLMARFPDFSSSINEYTDYLVDVVAPK